jgi:dihydrofolate reductase
MRKVIASLFVSLDGVTEKPESWHFPYFNDEMGAAIGQAMSSADAFLLGRRTYEEWSAYWPAQSPEENPRAAAVNGIVVSGSATLVRSLLREGVLDELRLMIHPVVVGSGGRLFEDADVQAPLELVGSETFSTGVLNLTYRPAKSESA